MSAPHVHGHAPGPGTPPACDLSVVAGFLDDWAEPEQGRHLLLSIVPDSPHPRGQAFEWPGEREGALRWVEEGGIRCGLAAGRFAAEARALALAGRIEADAAWRTVPSGLRAWVERILRDEPELPWAEAVARVAEARP